MNLNLPKLRLKLYLNKPIGEKSIHFESLNCLAFNSLVNTLNISTDRIEHLCFDGEQFDEGCLKLLKNNRNARTVNVLSELKNDEVASEFINLIKILPELKTLTTGKAKLTTHQIVDLISYCSTLERIFLSGKLILNELGKSIFDSLQPKWEVFMPFSCPCAYFFGQNVQFVKV